MYPETSFTTMRTGKFRAIDNVERLFPIDIAFGISFYSFEMIYINLRVYPAREILIRSCAQLTCTVMRLSDQTQMRSGTELAGL
jgi:hypothetical protein